MNKEAMQMFAAPIEGSLKDAMEVGETRLAGYEQSPPHQRTHAAEHHAKLIDCRGRYRRFRHANSLPNPTRAVLNMTPRNLPLSETDPNSPTCVSTRASICRNWWGPRLRFT